MLSSINGKWRETGITTSFFSKKKLLGAPPTHKNKQLLILWSDKCFYDRVVYLLKGAIHQFEIARTLPFACA